MMNGTTSNVSSVSNQDGLQSQSASFNNNSSSFPANDMPPLIVPSKMNNNNSNSINNSSLLNQAMLQSLPGGGGIGSGVSVSANGPKTKPGQGTLTSRSDTVSASVASPYISSAYASSFPVSSSSASAGEITSGSSTVLASSLSPGKLGYGNDLINANFLSSNALNSKAYMQKSKSSSSLAPVSPNPLSQYMNTYVYDAQAARSTMNALLNTYNNINTNSNNNHNSNGVYWSTNPSDSYSSFNMNQGNIAFNNNSLHASSYTSNNGFHKSYSNNIVNSSMLDAVGTGSALGPSLQYYNTAGVSINSNANAGLGTSVPPANGSRFQEDALAQLQKQVVSGDALARHKVKQKMLMESRKLSELHTGRT
jgi:hypothetical protein